MNVCSQDNLSLGINGDLHIVALDELMLSRRLHNPGIGIGEVPLDLVIRLHFVDIVGGRITVEFIVIVVILFGRGAPFGFVFRALFASRSFANRD